MARTNHPRLQTPALALLIGTVIAGAVGFRQGLGTALGSEAIALFWAAGLYFLGSSDSDTGSVIGDQGDERQQLVGLRAARLSLAVLVVALSISCLIAAAANDSIWPFELLLVIIGSTYFIGLHAFGIDPDQTQNGANFSRLGFRKD
jgi:hypothetical protein